MLLSAYATASLWQFDSLSIPNHSSVITTFAPQTPQGLCAACLGDRTQPNTHDGDPPLSGSKCGAAGGSIALCSCLPEWSSVKIKTNKNPLRAEETENKSDTRTPF